MAGIHDFIEYEDDFIGTSATFPTSADPATPWLAVKTGTAPTYVRNAGNAILTMTSTSEVQNICLAHGDALSFDIDDIQWVKMRIKVSGCTSGTSISWGLGSARNDDPTAMTALALFRMVGATSTTAVTVETDDNVVDTTPVTTAYTQSTTFKDYVIDFSGGKRNVKFYQDDSSGLLKPVATSTTFDMSNYTAGLQPYFQIQKTSSANVDALTIDFVKVRCKRS